MTNLDNNNRVLSRQGARELTVPELEIVNGAFSGTNACSFIHLNIKTTTVTGADCDTHDSDTGNDA